MKPLAIKLYLAPIKTDQFFRWSVRSCILAFAGSIFLLVWFWQKLPPQVPFFYSLTWGEEQLAPPMFLIVFIFCVLILFLANVFLALFLHPRTVYLARLLVIGTTTVSLLGLYTLAHILFLIT